MDAANMKKPKVETGYQIIDGLDMLDYVEKKSGRGGLKNRLSVCWKLSNDTYIGLQGLDWLESEYKDGFVREENYQDYKAVLQEFPELKQNKTLLLICW